MKKSFGLSALNLSAFNIAQQIIIATLVEEIEWLKERATRLEQQLCLMRSQMEEKEKP